MKRLILASCAVLALVASTPTNLAQRHSRGGASPAALAQAKSAMQVKALAQSQAQSECSGLTSTGCLRNECDRVNYDHTCDYLRDYDCLRNSIDILGGKIILVNLDDRCQVEELEREGIFLELGDVVVFAGRGFDS